MGGPVGARASIWPVEASQLCRVARKVFETVKRRGTFPGRTAVALRRHISVSRHTDWQACDAASLRQGQSLQPTVAKGEAKAAVSEAPIEPMTVMLNLA
jgi:hypothetical protein